MINPLFKKIIEIFDSFPEIGPRQAWRLFFWFIKQDKKFQNKFLNFFQILISQLNFCEKCFFPTIEDKLCNICSDNKRNFSQLCIVARETDLITIENLKKYKGLYFVLGGLILPFENKEIIKERLKKIEERLANDNKIKEVIISLPFTREAELTKKIVEKIISKFNLKVRKLKKGIPTGGEIEFIDPETLEEALGL
ncbi:MAG: toprim domain-containing protein [Patescibacteria group bacterium]|nr:toprim domain-containing protein [Patescibacteria group bacterium]